jgi:DNA-binding HxlR family transcriptional regulator
LNLSLIELCHHRWALPILAELHHLGGGSKFVTLVNRLNISKDALSRTLQALLEMELIERNLVYAHPLRPEYLLCGASKPIAQAASVLLERLPSDVLLKKWALPTLEALLTEKKFSALLKHLKPITNRALALTLTDLELYGLLERNSMTLTTQGRKVAEQMAQLHAALRLFIVERH